MAIKKIYKGSTDITSQVLKIYKGTTEVYTQAPTTYTVTLNINYSEPSEEGYATGGGSYAPGEQVTISMITFGNTYFEYWQLDGTDTKIYNSTYTFTMPNYNVTYVAYCVVNICLVEGTLITLYDLTKKPIEDITYEDELLVWDFDNATPSFAKPIWIFKKGQASKYNRLVFSDGSELNTVEQHRIFNVEKGMFTYPMTNDTPIGTTTYNDKGEYVKLISKEVIEKRVEYYNIITDYHINCFASGILTSCRLSNLYPIQNLMYQKDNRSLHDISMFNELDNKWISGLRLLEQPLEINRDNAVVHDNSLVDYVKRLERMKADEK